jgi:hypothetical protein
VQRQWQAAQAATKVFGLFPGMIVHERSEIPKHVSGCVVFE